MVKKKRYNKWKVDLSGESDEWREREGFGETYEANRLQLADGEDGEMLRLANGMGFVCLPWPSLSATVKSVLFFSYYLLMAIGKKERISR